MDNKQYLPTNTGILEKLREQLRCMYYRKYIKVFDRLNEPNMLEVGVGPGYFLDAAYRSKTFGSITGVDIEPDLVAYAKSKVPEVKLHELDALSVSSIGGTFDIIYSFQAIEHIDNPLLFLNEVHTILEERGFFVFTTPNPESISANMLGQQWQGIRDDHVSVLPKSAWCSLLTQAGFEVVEYGSTFLNGLPLIGRGPFALPFYALQLLFGWLPWEKGESHVFVARKI